MGNGAIATGPNSKYMRLPDEMIISGCHFSFLVDDISNNFSDSSNTSSSKFSSRVILFPTNVSVGEISSYWLILGARIIFMCLKIRFLDA